MGALNALKALAKHGAKAIRKKSGKGGRRGRGRGRRFTAAHASKLMILKQAVGHGPAFQAAAMNFLSKLKL